MTRPIMRRTAQSLPLLLVFLVSSLPCEAGWTPKSLMPQTSSFSYQCTTATAAGPQDDAVAAWLDEPTGLAYTAVRRGGVWGASKPIYIVPPNAPEEIIEVKVALGDDGTAVAAFVLSHFDRYLAYRVVMAATMARGTSVWTPAVEISPRGVAEGIWLGADGAGNALALWKNASAVMSATKPAGGGWSSAQPVMGCPRIDAFSMNSAGASIVAWSESNGASTTLKAINGQADGTWSPPFDIASITGPVYDVEAATDGQGRSALACLGISGGTTNVLLSRESATGAWSAPAALNSAGASAYAVDLGADANGDVAIVWSDFDSDASEFRVRAQVRFVNGTIDEQSWITTDAGVGTVDPPSVSISPDGSLVVVGWIDDSLAQAFAATYTPAMLWSAPALIGGGLYQNEVSLACGPGATACAVWPVPGPAEFIIGFRASSYKLVYPVPTLASVSPWMAALGSGPRDVSITGLQFLAVAGGTTLQWDGSDRPTDPVSRVLAVGHLAESDLNSEGVHIVTVKNTSPGGGVSRPRTFIVDGTPPTTSVSLAGRAGANGWYTGSVRVLLNGADALSGLGAIEYVLDATAPVRKTYPVSTPLAAPKSLSFSVSGDRVHSLTFTSADNVSNVDEQQAVTIKIDTTAPTIAATATPRVLRAAEGATAAVTLTYLFTDQTSGIDPASARYTVVDEYGLCQPGGLIGQDTAGSVILALDTHRDPADLDGRVYAITVSVNDMAGLARSKTIQVAVR